MPVPKVSRFYIKIQTWVDVFIQNQKMLVPTGYAKHIPINLKQIILFETKFHWQIVSNKIPKLYLWNYFLQIQLAQWQRVRESEEERNREEIQKKTERGSLKVESERERGRAENERTRENLNYTTIHSLVCILWAKYQCTCWRSLFWHLWTVSEKVTILAFATLPPIS